MLLFSFSLASFALLSNKNLVSENSQNTHENDSVVGDDSSGMNKSKYTTALTGGNGGGRSGGDGEQSNSSPQGGNGVIPVYAAGAAAAQRRNHKGDAATCSPCWKGGFAIFIVIVLSSLLLQIPM
ncbi:hypothetical protein Ccrd_014213 [Cynara cardunculus var. scolymus]|uniref:Uncharacterized protein n=2 Tax=Cynara cardunculus var. scolymus TaxID=59895 RepID=A0A118K4F6_CYNCS|nr:hypothetical protein Ccrd_014213 [Cynara cardunculus var. scolymus]